jgi:hypothetical protein
LASASSAVIRKRIVRQRIAERKNRSRFPDQFRLVFALHLTRCVPLRARKMRQNKDARAATADCIALMTNHGCGDSLQQNRSEQNTSK